ncbi:hypothetical protein PG993_007682 [Apiospora rasikravindrae]|uniref:Uncharacterized protein n=1 Tax=Apiospora rasikravindrae TaxID=990691 RepID=A0ABR1SY66_9PEZI
MSSTDYRHAAAAQYPYQQSVAADGFTPEMRDRQARGKDPYHDSGDDSEGASGDWGGRNRGSRDESYAYTEQRRHAAQILDNPELLMTNAQREGDVSSGPRSSSLDPHAPHPLKPQTLDPSNGGNGPGNSSCCLPNCKPFIQYGPSIPAMRLRYTRMLCGVVEEPAPSTSSKQSGDKKKKTKSSRHSSSGGQKSSSSTPKKRSSHSDRSSRTH